MKGYSQVWLFVDGRPYTQDIADILLDAEVKLGELLEAIEPKRHGLGSKGGTSPSLPQNITKKESHFSQVIAKSKVDTRNHLTLTAMVISMKLSNVEAASGPIIRFCICGPFAHGVRYPQGPGVASTT